MRKGGGPPDGLLRVVAEYLSQSWNFSGSGVVSPFMKPAFVAVLSLILLATPSLAGDPARCFGQQATIEGTSDDERIPGTPTRDVIVGGGGDDHILASGGRDLVCGGWGEDSIRGGDGADRLNGMADGDLLLGGRGHDSLRGEAGGDVLYGGAGSDRYNGGEDRDLCRVRAHDRRALGCEADPVDDSH